MGLQMDRSTIIKWIVAIGVPLSLLLIPLSETFTYEIRTFLILSVMAILIIALGIMEMIIPAVALPTLYVVLKVTDNATAFGAFATQTLWVILGAYVFTVIMDECGVLKRIAYTIIKRLGGSYNATLYAIYIVGVVLGQLCFCGHYFLMITFVFGICQAMNLKPYSKECAIMMGVGGMAALNVKVFLYQTSNMSLLTAGMQTVFPDFMITPIQLFMYNFPEFIVALLFIFIITKVFHTDQVQFEGGKAYFEKMHREMGKMRMVEKKAAVILVLLMAYIILQPLHQFNLNFGFMVIPWLCFLPGINIGTPESVEKIKGFFGTFLFAGCCIAIGQVATKLGLGNMLAQAALPILAPMGKVGMTYGVLLAGGAANLLLSPSAMCSLLPNILGSIYEALGYNPMGAALTVIYSLDIVFLPHEVPAYLILFGFGMMNMKQFIAFFGGKCAFTILMFGLLQLPWWHFLGVL